MWARSSLLLSLLVACGGKKEPPPLEIDPAKIQVYAMAIYQHAPSMGNVLACGDDAWTPGGIGLTQVSLNRLAKVAPDGDAVHEEFVNPVAADDPLVRLILDPPAGTDPHLVKQAAWKFLQAPYYAVYRIDNMQSPLAIGVKDLKRGTIEARVLKQDRNGKVFCIKRISFQSDAEVSRKAIADADKQPGIPKAVIKALQDDLRQQYLKAVPVLPLQ